MQSQRRVSHVLAVVVSACVVVQSSIAPVLIVRAAEPPAATPAAPAPDVDGGWPRDYATTSGGTVRVFQPQVASWDGQRHMVAYAAVSYSAKGAANPALGTVTIEADTSVAVAERLVDLHPNQGHRNALLQRVQRSAAGAHVRHYQ